MTGRGRRVTVVDVAHAAGCSVATVSRALRGFENVSPAMMARVRAVADALGYRPNQLAAGLRSGATRAVLVVVPVIDHWYFSELMAGAEAVLSDDGYDTFVAAAAHRSGLERLVTNLGPRGRVDGVLLADNAIDPGVRAMLDHLGVPYVVAGADAPGVPSVAVDEHRIGYEATAHLLGLGHTRIGVAQCLSEPALRSVSPAARLAGHVAALVDAGIEPDPSLRIEVELSLEGGVAAASFVVGHEEPPTALFCMSDLLAIGAFHALYQLGFDVPGFLSLIGVDDLELAEVTGLTTIRQPVAEVGATAARMLLDALGGSIDRNHVVLPVELVARDTTAHRPGPSGSGGLPP